MEPKAIKPATSSSVGGSVIPRTSTVLVAINMVEGPANGIRPNPNDVSNMPVITSRGIIIYALSIDSRRDSKPESGVTSLLAE